MRIHTASLTIKLHTILVGNWQKVYSFTRQRHGSVDGAWWTASKQKTKGKPKSESKVATLRNFPFLYNGLRVLSMRFLDGGSQEIQLTSSFLYPFSFPIESSSQAWQMGGWWWTRCSSIREPGAGGFVCVTHTEPNNNGPPSQNT